MKFGNRYFWRVLTAAPVQRVILGFSLLMLFGGAATAATRIINLGLNEATPLKYQTPVDTVFIANPEIADYQVVRGNQLIIYGKQVGSTTLVVLDEKGKTIDNKTLVVNKSLAHIRQQVAIRFPEHDIDITNLGDQVVLTGTVPSEELRQNIYYLIGELLGKEYEDYKINWDLGSQELEIDFMTRRRFRWLVNNIKVSEVKQVNVKITVAEVSHSFIRQLGVKWGTMVSTGGSANFLGNGKLFQSTLRSFNSQDIARYITAIDDDSVGQVLAEPNLSVISGETASFLAGGEIPIIYYNDQSYNVEYKEFGIRLEMAAKVLSDDKIKISMMPEVSAVDSTYKDTVLSIPTFKTRRARTTIQLADGESFVLGGLLNSEDREALAKIPLIGDLPVIGALFRHTESERRKSELIIVATVSLVQPVPTGTVQVPRHNFTNTLLRYFRLDLPGRGGEERYQQQVQSKEAQKIMKSGGFK
ncbi:type II and III secretion system protein family protein [Sansalvadorimonas sp. 2012CJ34-2]|uniref:Type II and III secretion system protein family protein n=1 Tax=Parendozoicomonas callyspongiae TaxID=2942213 RepID=A0ABT0PAV6_9GAMM|nr:type II and III secretion system protein family protein [Sansalvadorimonas sp. 2012CJ34-2]MCL6268527.1 type II and III secretion system protein family protein [Sansalvadorimonas sp. 2012CJ34-2]